ncbi:hypothetical protein ACH5RR_031894 [Cinchona calisaya]|uniref:Uncharacterized protein n=1 Tax=Cinchona calisaya TaxID=153742 RepID=A0ABD2YJJ6_9GENT
MSIFLGSCYFWSNVLSNSIFPKLAFITKCGDLFQLSLFKLFNSFGFGRLEIDNIICSLWLISLISLVNSIEWRVPTNSYPLGGFSIGGEFLPKNYYPIGGFLWVASLVSLCSLCFLLMSLSLPFSGIILWLLCNMKLVTKDRLRK